jgi:hypothetical protein
MSALFTGESNKREAFITLGRFRVPKFIHKALIYLQGEACHATLRDSSIHLMKLGTLWIERHGLHSGQDVTIRDIQAQAETKQVIQ